MKNLKIRNILGSIIGIMLILSSFFGCGKTSTVTGPSVHDTVYVKMAHLSFKTVLGGTGISQVSLPKSAVLSKSTSISLNKLILVFTSSTSDTVRDTITSSTSPSITATSITAQTLNKNYTLKPLRTWKLVAKTLDLKDSVIHIDSVTTGQLNPSDTVNVNLPMTSKYQMYEVKFLTLPDSITSSVGGTGKQLLQVNRLKVVIDSGTANAIVIDSVNSYFSPLATSTLSYDYVTPGSHTLKMYVYGPMNFWDTSKALYYASTTINVTAGVDSTNSITMAWVGPTNGTGKLSITMGKVGKVLVNGTLPGTVIP